MQNTQDIKPLKEGRWLRRVALILIILLVACTAACQVFYYEERRLPEISGVVLDMKTGQAVAGAVVMASYVGPMLGLAPSSSPVAVGGGGTAKTGQDGRFSFPAGRMPVVSLRDLLFGPAPKSGISLLVYEKDYVPCLSESRGFSWAEDPGIRDWKCMCVTLRRNGDLQRGFTYSVRIARPQTEAEWREKVEITGAASQRLPDHLANEWRFNALTGYLERWPETQKRGQYVVNLLDLFMAIAGPFCGDDGPTIQRVTYPELREMQAKGELILRLINDTTIEQLPNNPPRRANWPGDRRCLTDCLQKIRARLGKADN